jgi:hypothetical protein
LGHDTRPFVLGAYVEPRIDERHDVEALASLVILTNAWLEPGTLDSFNSFNLSYTPALPTFYQPQLLFARRISDRNHRNVTLIMFRVAQTRRSTAVVATGMFTRSTTK